MKTLVAALVAVLLSFSAGAARAQTLGEVAAKTRQAEAEREALRKEVERLLEVSGSSQVAVQVATAVSGQVLEQLRSNPDIPPRAIEVAKQVLEEEFKAGFAAPDGLMAAIVRVYAKHFTADDVKQLLAFYTTDVGKKLVAKMPVLMQESMDASQKWAAREMPRITEALQQRLRKEGLIK